jgi:hypothetical protein
MPEGDRKESKGLLNKGRSQGWGEAKKEVIKQEQMVTTKGGDDM